METPRINGRSISRRTAREIHISSFNLIKFSCSVPLMVTKFFLVSSRFSGQQLLSSYHLRILIVLIITIIHGISGDFFSQINNLPPLNKSLKTAPSIYYPLIGTHLSHGDQVFSSQYPVITVVWLYRYCCHFGVYPIPLDGIIS